MKTKEKPLIGAEIGVASGKHAKQILNFLNIKQLVLGDPWKVYSDDWQADNTSPKGLDKFDDIFHENNYKKTVKKFSNKPKVKIIRDYSVNAAKIVDGTIVVGDIADDAVTADKLANSINTDIATGPAALPKAGGTMTGTLVAKVATTATDTDATNTGSITLDFSANQNFVLTLTGNVTLANPSTEAVGQCGFIACIQDGTGSRTLSLGTDYETAAAAGITLTTTASATDLVPYLVVAANRVLLGAPQLAFA